MPIDRKTLNLIRQVSDTRRVFITLANARKWAELIKIMKRPGWTTPAERVFVSGILTSMQQHGEALNGLQDRLRQGSRAVGLDR